MASTPTILVSAALLGLSLIPQSVAAVGGQSQGLESTTCPGDCDGSFSVEITDLTIGVNIAIGRSPLDDCISLDTNNDGLLSIAELVRAVISALEGCPCVGDFFNLTCGGTCPQGTECAPSSALQTCSCISATQPCGDTATQCNGECPVGEVCRTLQDFPAPGCGCIPEGTEPCGGTIGQCGGACPEGNVCSGLEVSSFAGCTCLSPDFCAPCAGTGFHCGVLPPEGDTLCVPEFCGGDAVYPTCGGTCPSGSACLPAAIDDFGVELCVCAPTDVPCDAMCGGVACPSGSACIIGTEGCGCQQLP